MKTNLRSLLFFLSPALILLSIFLLIPIGAAVYMSFNKIGVEALIDPQTISFVGVANYTQIIFHDELFRKALLNTIIVLVIAMPLTVVLSLSLAVLINSKLTKFSSLFRVGFYLPAISNTIAVALVWKWLLNGDYGLINYLLSLVGIDGPQWLTNEHTAIFTIIMLVVWKGIGPNTILYMAALSSVPDSVKEAAEIDGASAWQRFIKITVPMLAPTTTYISIMLLIGYLQLFEEPFMLTGGGPVNSTTSIVMLIYNEAFKYFNFGYASAISMVLFFIIFAVSLIRIKLTKLGS
ncbi:MAG: sugar ABC transporter permease [Neisseriales bacterium]|jgi:multiple sugar transport system permease protein|nr:MAG: sugar ABC transporter permease [Neisseriales bacterium]HRG63096.1 sugar ABC transporter permease [Burkholderiales bacterium]